MTENEPYYCPECDRKHHYGNIYEEHKKYKEEDKEEKIVYKTNDEGWNKLPSIARAQMLRLAEKLLRERQIFNKIFVPAYQLEMSRILQEELTEEYIFKDESATNKIKKET